MKFEDYVSSVFHLNNECLDEIPKYTPICVHFVKDNSIFTSRIMGWFYDVRIIDDAVCLCIYNDRVQLDDVEQTDINSKLYNISVMEIVKIETLDVNEVIFDKN